MKIIKVLLILIAVICIGVAVSYPIRYKLELDSNNDELEDLSSMRRRVMVEQNIVPRDEARESTGAQTPPEVHAPEADAPETDVPEADVPGDDVPRDDVPGDDIPGDDVPGDDVPGDDVPETAPATEASDGRTEAAQPTEGPAAEPATQPAEIPATAATQPAEIPATQPATQSAEIPATAATQPAAAAQDAVTAAPTQMPTDIMFYIIDDVDIATPTPPATSTPRPSPSPTPSPTPNRNVQTGPDTFEQKAKIRLDEDKILPELKEIYALNHDLVGWLYIEDTNVDYPVVQSEDRTFYLSHDFYRRSNANGQIILEAKCDPYTPSYNLVLSGHHMNSGAMFGRLGKYKDKAYWETHKIVEFDTLMARKRYVIFAAFYSADYDENEEGFRYSADIQYKREAVQWLEEIRENQIYETGVEAEFGDEFITLTTCDHTKRYNGRFVLVARRIREGERIQ